MLWKKRSIANICKLHYRLEATSILFARRDNFLLTSNMRTNKIMQTLLCKIQSNLHYNTVGSLYENYFLAKKPHVFFFMASPPYRIVLLLSFSGFFSSFPGIGCRMPGAGTLYTVIFIRAIHIMTSGT
jgi:hypothetical protein